jgi:uncharacterized metal-binding protein YceD (DUF177 family)
VKAKHLYVIPFKGLKIGKHEFVYEIDDHFFEGHPESEIQKGRVKVEILMEKRSTMLEFRFLLNGEVTVTCDRCLDEFEMPVEFESVLFVKFGEEPEEQSDEIIVLSHNDFELDVEPYIYEFIHLSLPVKRVHPDDASGLSTCNKEMLKKLNEYIVRENESDIDPRWNDLKNLLNNN